MNLLRPNELFYMALMLDLDEIGALCNSDKYHNKTLCQNDNFWKFKVYRDYPVDLIKMFTTNNNGISYKELYKLLSRKEININFSIVNFGSPEEEEVHEIHLEYIMTVDLKIPIEQIKENITKSLIDFAKELGYYGTYTVTIDDENICDDMAHLTEYCFDTINYNTRYINVYLDTSEYVDERDAEEYQALMIGFLKR